MLGWSSPHSTKPPPQEFVDGARSLVRNWSLDSLDTTFGFLCRNLCRMRVGYLDLAVPKAVLREGECSLAKELLERVLATLSRM